MCKYESDRNLSCQYLLEVMHTAFINSAEVAKIFATLALAEHVQKTGHP